MKLTTLSPQWLRHDHHDGSDYLVHVDSFAKAMGIRFVCPKCQGTNDEHRIVLWFHGTGVPDAVRPQGRWVAVGSMYDNLTLNAPPGKTRSVLLLSGCQWHGWITNGDVTNA